MMTGYELIDSGDGRKLERFGEFILIRPCSAAVWKPYCRQREWDQAHAIFSREEGEGRWTLFDHIPQEWQMETGGLQFRVAPTEFGHLGLFPEHEELWKWMGQQLERTPGARVLNLFAYSGAATLAAAKAGAEVCHVDAAKGMVEWAQSNAALNRLQNTSIRWIVDEAVKFVAREVRRGRRYHGVILDPPTFGRGVRGEIFKIDREIQILLSLCRELLEPKPSFFIFSCHTPTYTPMTMHHLLGQALSGLNGRVHAGELALRGKKGVLPVPSGTYARWSGDS